MTVEQRLRDQGLHIPEPGQPAFDYQPYSLNDGVIQLAGQLAKQSDGEIANFGQVGISVSEEEAGAQMELAALHAIGWLRKAADGDLERIGSILHLNAWVACHPDFDGMSSLADRCSAVLIKAFGESGRHPRSVLGLVRLPRNAPVMIDLRASIREA